MLVSTTGDGGGGRRVRSVRQGTGGGEEEREGGAGQKGEVRELHLLDIGHSGRHRPGRLHVGHPRHHLSGGHIQGEDSPRQENC